MFEFQQEVLPDDFYEEKPAPYNRGTYVWGYLVGDSDPSWPGTTVEALKGRTTTVKYINTLPLDPFLRLLDPSGQLGERGIEFGLPIIDDAERGVGKLVLGPDRDGFFQG